MDHEGVNPLENKKHYIKTCFIVEARTKKERETFLVRRGPFANLLLNLFHVKLFFL